MTRPSYPAYTAQDGDPLVQELWLVDLTGGIVLTASEDAAGAVPIVD